MIKERVRFAPSPTGPLHIGGLRTALFNYLYTKNVEGTFILRIEDTDRKRFVKDSEKYIEEALSWCGIVPDESPALGGDYGPYRQSERIDLYREKIKILIESNNAYYAFDSSEKLGELRKNEEGKGLIFKYDYSVRETLDNSLSMSDKDISERIKTSPYVIRLKVNAGETTSNDLLRGYVNVDNSVLDDKILIKADGFPTYHFANVVDDYLMKITTVIRGEEWLPSLAVHSLIYKAFGWQEPSYLHLPLILKPFGKGKLSKRDGTKGGFPVFPLVWEKEKGFKDLGFLKIGMVNYLALLGWNPGNNNELFSIKELIKYFKIEGLQKGGAKFDFEKAKWVNQQHLSKINFEDFEREFPGNVMSLKQNYPSKYEEVFLLVRERIKLADDLGNEINLFISDPRDYDQKTLNKLHAKADIEAVVGEIESVVKEKNLNSLKENLNVLSDDKNINFGLIMQLLRLALVGKLSGPDIIKASIIIEKDVTLRRLANLKNHIKNSIS